MTPQERAKIFTNLPAIGYAAQRLEKHRKQLLRNGSDDAAACSA
jgi:hypothetical protein